MGVLRGGRAAKRGTYCLPVPWQAEHLVGPPKKCWISPVPLHSGQVGLDPNLNPNRLPPRVAPVYAAHSSQRPFLIYVRRLQRSHLSNAIHVHLLEKI